MDNTDKKKSSHHITVKSILANVAHCYNNKYFDAENVVGVQTDDATCHQSDAAQVNKPLRTLNEVTN